MKSFFRKALNWWGKEKNVYTAHQKSNNRSSPYENVQQYFINIMAEIETRFFARFLLFF